MWRDKGRWGGHRQPRREGAPGLDGRTGKVEGGSMRSGSRGFHERAVAAREGGRARREESPEPLASAVHLPLARRARDECREVGRVVKVARPAAVPGGEDGRRETLVAREPPGKSFELQPVFHGERDGSPMLRAAGLMTPAWSRRAEEERGIGAGAAARAFGQSAAGDGSRRRGRIRGREGATGGTWIRRRAIRACGTGGHGPSLERGFGPRAALRRRCSSGRRGRRLAPAPGTEGTSAFRAGA